MSHNPAFLSYTWADKLMALIEYLEDLDDVQNVYSNAELPEEVEA